MIALRSLLHSPDHCKTRSQLYEFGKVMRDLNKAVPKDYIFLSSDDLSLSAKAAKYACDTVVVTSALFTLQVELGRLETNEARVAEVKKLKALIDEKNTSRTDSPRLQHYIPLHPGAKPGVVQCFCPGLARKILGVGRGSGSWSSDMRWGRCH